MKATNEKVYRCDFCNKAIVSKGSMIVHEKHCRMNPKNAHKCFEFCANLIKREIEIDYCADESGYRKEFECAITGDLMYSYKLERFNRNKDRIKFLKRMPLECDNYKDPSENVVEEMFSKGDYNF